MTRLGFTFFVLIALIGFTTGCGQKGPLKPAAPTEKPSTAP